MDYKKNISEQIKESVLNGYAYWENDGDKKIATYQAMMNSVYEYILKNGEKFLTNEEITKLSALEDKNDYLINLIQEKKIIEKLSDELIEIDGLTYYIVSNKDIISGMF